MRILMLPLVAFGGLLSCSSDEPGGYTCKELPAGLEVPVGRTTADKVAHWALQPGCIAASFDPALAGRLADIQAALDAWSSVDCSSLCFHPPREQVVAPSGDATDRRLHFAVEQLPQAGQQTAESLAAVVMHVATGVVLTARISLARSDIDRAELVRLVGEALPLRKPAAGVDSALTPGSGRLTPSASDVQSLCALYGKPALCRE